MRTGLATFTATLCLLAGSAAHATEYFIAPGGSDANDGLTSGAPLKTFDHALPLLGPGDTLTLLDGTYTRAGSGMIYADCSGGSRRSGAEGAPVTIRAQNERQAWIKGDGSQTPVRITQCAYWDLTGLHVSSAALDQGAGDVILVTFSDHIRIRRVLAHTSNRYLNNAVIGVNTSHHCLVEDTEIYDFHRHGLGAWGSDSVVLRRVYANGRGATDVDDGWGSHACCTEGGDEGFSLYYTSNSIVENCISVDSEQLSIISGLDTILGNPGGQNNRGLGNISYRDLRPGFVQSRQREPSWSIARDNVIRDYLVVGGAETASFQLRGAKNTRMENVTFYGTTMESIVFNSAAGDQYPGCVGHGGCDYALKNVLFLNADTPLLYLPDDPYLEVVVEYADAYDRASPGTGFDASEPVNDQSGVIQRSSEVDPTRMGLGQGECLVYTPPDSSMATAGEGGGPVGAQIVYRYVDGALTGEPLWDPQTGAFPCGAIVPGINDVAGDSCFDVHTLLGVGGCTLPYGQSGQLEVSIEASPLQGTAPLDVSFRAVTTGGTAPYRWDWSFGDGSAISHAADPTHTFQAGSYTVVLTATDATGATSTASASIRVAEPSETTVFAPVPYFGDAANWSPQTPSRWSVVEEDGDEAYFLSTSDYAGNGERPGEISVAQGRVFEDFVMTLEAKTNEVLAENDGADYVVVFGYQDPDNFYFLLVHAKPSGNNLFVIEDGVRTQLYAHQQAMLTDEAWHQLQIARTGSLIEVNLDGALQFSVEDDTLGAGAVGVGSYDESVFFDDIDVTPPSDSEARAVATGCGGCGVAGGGSGPGAGLALLLMACFVFRRSRRSRRRTGRS